MRGSRFVLVSYIVFLLLPIYWLVNMSLKTNTEITGPLTLFPHELTFDNYIKIFTDSSWYMGYVHAVQYVVINTVISVTLALPAAYAFSRYRFVGDKHLFFWLLTNRMAPAAVFALPFFNLYQAVGLFDTVWAVALAHCLFNVPLAVWILEGFISGVPREIDETAQIDGYSFPHYFVKIFIPLIGNGIGVAAFFCFMFSWVELPQPASSPSCRAPSSSISSAITSPRALPSGGFKEDRDDRMAAKSRFRLDGLDMADCPVLRLHRPRARDADGFGRHPPGDAAARYFAHCHNTGGPFVHLPRRQCVHRNLLDRLFHRPRGDGDRSMGSAGIEPALRHRGIPLCVGRFNPQKEQGISTCRFTFQHIIGGAHHEYCSRA